MSRINVTQTFLPPFEEYEKTLRRAWEKKWITNNGELVQELEQKLKEYLGVKHLFFTNNGTVVLQMAIKALGIKGDIITTPFSYVATTNAILWENCNPVFADIDPDTFNIDPKKIEEAITADTKAILATHVYGIPCDIEAIRDIAGRHGLKVIYDGAHAFGSVYNGKALLSYGDISTCSFHATKVFHTVEGGCIITGDDAIAEKLRLYRSFGHIGDTYYDIGINAKSSEFHAAMGLTVLQHLPELIGNRKKAAEYYEAHIRSSSVRRPSLPGGLTYNYAYYPLVFSSHEEMMRMKMHLEENEIFTRRYFYPSLNQLPFLSGHPPMPVSDDIASRVLCIPMYGELDLSTVKRIVDTINVGFR